MDDNEEARFLVVVNHEDQHSIWPAHRELPPGWQQVGSAGSRAECLRYVAEHWTDLRPRSLREHLARAASEGAEAPAL